MTTNQVIRRLKQIVEKALNVLGEDFQLDGWTITRINDDQHLGYSVLFRFIGIDLSEYIMRAYIPENYQVVGKGYRWYPKRPYGDGSTYGGGFYGQHGPLQYFHNGKYYAERNGLGNYGAIRVFVDDRSNYRYFSQRRHERVVMARVWDIREGVEELSDEMIRVVA